MTQRNREKFTIMGLITVFLADLSFLRKGVLSWHIWVEEDFLLLVDKG